MTTRFFVTPDGAFIGAFGDGALPDDPAAIEVPDAPPHGAAIWQDGTWQWDERTSWRMGRSLDRAGFCRALMAHSILPPAEAVDAAKGNWPPTFAAALATLPGIDPFGAQIDWASAPSVGRLNPLFQVLLGWHAAQNDLTPTEAAALGDLIFGWTDPSAATPTE
jgi:hypothetical protein